MRDRYYISFDAGVNYTEFFPTNTPKILIQKETGEIFFRNKVDKFKIGRLKNSTLIIPVLGTTVYDTLEAWFFDNTKFSTEIKYKITIKSTEKFRYYDNIQAGNIDQQNRIYECTPEPDDLYRPILAQYDRKWQQRTADTLFAHKNDFCYPVLNTAYFVNDAVKPFTTWVPDVAHSITWGNNTNDVAWAYNDLDILTVIGSIIIIIIKNFVLVAGTEPKMQLREDVSDGGPVLSNSVNVTAGGKYILRQTANSGTGNVYLELSQVDLIGGSSGSFTYEVFLPTAKESGGKLYDIIYGCINDAAFMNLSYTVKSTILWNDALPTNPPPTILAYITANPNNDYVLSAAAIWNEKSLGAAYGALWLSRVDSFTTAKEDIIELSFKDLMTLLKKIRMYWFIDNDNNFRIEHEYYFRDYAVQADLTSATYSADKPEVDRKRYSYEMSDIANQINYSENNESHEDWLAYPVIYSTTLTEKNIRDISFADLTTDFEYIRDNVGTASNTGVMLLKTIGNTYMADIDQSIITTTNYYANCKLGWAYLVLNYYKFFAETKSGTVNNGTAITYTHVKEYLKQGNIRFKMTADLDWKKPFTLSIGIGWLISAEYIPETGWYTISVGFDCFTV
jgi:hypothetical protein